MTDVRIRCLDVGGSFIKCTDGSQVPSVSRGTREEIVNALKAAVGPADALSGLGVAIPGPFDYRNGIFLMKHKFSSVYGESFRDLTALPSGVDIRFMHDVNAVLAGAVDMLGLWDENCAIVTVGTGLGFSYAENGQIRVNDKGSPLRSLWDLPWEGGILEDRISARGIASAYAELTGDGCKSACDIAEKAFEGEANAERVYFETGELLGKTLESLVDELGLDVIFLGGQVSKSSDLFIGPLQDALPGVDILSAPEGAVFIGLENLFRDDTHR